MDLYTVDSVRGGIIRLLLRRDENFKIELPQHELPGVQEGDIISAEIVAGSLIRFAMEEEETTATRSRIQAKLDKLKNRSGR